MTSPNIKPLIMLMFMILVINLMTTKTSIMCLNLMMYTILLSMMMSKMISLTPIPFIIFLTIIGGLMVIFLYLAATLWMKKEKLTLKMKILMMIMIIIPSINSTKALNMVTSTTPKMNLFQYPMNNMTMILIIMLTIMLIFTIEMHMKMNLPFRRKLKIWD